MSSTTTTKTQAPAQFGVGKDIEIPRGPTTSALIFYAPPADGSTPFNYVEKQPEGQPQRNYGEEPHEVTIADIRGRERDFDLNTSGFAVVQGVPSAAPPDFADDAAIRDIYYPETEALLKAHVPGASRIFLFDHTVRRSGPDARRAPVTRAHVDQTTASARARVRHHLPADADALLAGRVRLVNVWRPLNGPVVASPLAFADSRSVPDAHIVPVEHRYPDRTGQTAGVSHTDLARWHYWSGMANDERILLQCYDSRDGARTPHSAFVDSRTQPDWPGRESIEVRALVFG